jgi:hypothetical protein
MVFEITVGIEGEIVAEMVPRRESPERLRSNLPADLTGKTANGCHH